MIAGAIIAQLEGVVKYPVIRFSVFQVPGTYKSASAPETGLRTVREFQRNNSPTCSRWI
jgi:hypothetical protein